MQVILTRRSGSKCKTCKCSDYGGYQSLGLIQGPWVIVTRIMPTGVKAKSGGRGQEGPYPSVWLRKASFLLPVSGPAVDRHKEGGVGGGSSQLKKWAHASEPPIVRGGTHCWPPIGCGGYRVILGIHRGSRGFEAHAIYHPPGDMDGPNRTSYYSLLTGGDTPDHHQSLILFTKFSVHGDRNSLSRFLFIWMHSI